MPLARTVHSSISAIVLQWKYSGKGRASQLMVLNLKQKVH
jgi:hypothetical protein